MAKSKQKYPKINSKSKALAREMPNEVALKIIRRSRQLALQEGDCWEKLGDFLVQSKKYHDLKRKFQMWQYDQIHGPSDEPAIDYSKWSLNDMLRRISSSKMPMPPWVVQQAMRDGMNNPQHLFHDPVTL